MNMKKNVNFFLTRILYSLFIMATILALIIFYKGIDTTISTNFVLGYVFFAFFMVLYIPFITIVNARNFKWDQIRKRIVKFISMLMLFTAVTYGFNLIVRSSEIDLLKIFSTSLGLSFSIAFFDIIFSK